MTWNLQDDELLRSYLLGTLPEKKMQRLERRLLEEDELFLLAEAVEADLLAAYARDELSEAEAKRVFQRLGSAGEGQARLALARSLTTMAAESQPEPAVSAAVVPLRRGAPSFRPGWAALAAATLVAVAVAGALWLAVPAARQSGQPQQTANRIAAPPSRTRANVPKMPGAPAAEAPAATMAQTQPDRHTPRGERTATQRAAPPEPAVIALALTTLRGAEEVEAFHIQAGTEVIEIQLDLEGLEDLGPFHAAVRSQDHKTVWEGSGLAPRRLDWGPALVLDVPAERLPSGRYEVAVTGGGSEELTQTFEVVRATG
jgi:hypothetical protein